MTEILQGFSTPADMPAYTKWPSMAQLLAGNALLVFKPISRQDDVVTDKQPQPHTVLRCDVTVLKIDAPITVVLDQHNQITAQLETPVTSGTTMQGFTTSHGWFVTRLKERCHDTGWPGIVGRLGQYKTAKGMGWCLTDPTPAELEMAGKWLAWKRQQPQASTPTAPAPQAVQAPAAVAPQPAVQAPWEASGAATPAPATAKAPWEQ